MPSCLVASMPARHSSSRGPSSLGMGALFRLVRRYLQHLLDSSLSSGHFHTWTMASDFGNLNDKAALQESDITELYFSSITDKLSAVKRQNETPKEHIRKVIQLLFPLSLSDLLTGELTRP